MDRGGDSNVLMDSTFGQRSGSYDAIAIIGHLFCCRLAPAFPEFCHPCRDLCRLRVLPANGRRIGIAAESTSRPVGKLVGIAAAFAAALIARFTLRALPDFSFPIVPIDFLPILPQAGALPRSPRRP